jgi:hypothetical protein
VWTTSDVVSTELEDEYCTEAPDGEAPSQASEFGEAEADEADNDDDVPPKAINLSEARDTLLKCQLFFEENQDDPDMRPLLPQIR